MDVGLTRASPNLRNGKITRPPAPECSTIYGLMKVLWKSVHNAKVELRESKDITHKGHA